MDPNFSVRFRIQREGATVVNQTFTDAAAARTYFEGATIDLRSTTTGVSGDLDIRFFLDVTGDTPGAGIAIDYIFGNSTITNRAVPYLPTTSVVIGNIRQNESSLQGIEVANVAVIGSDNVDASFTGTTGSAIATGFLSMLAASSNDSSSLIVGIDTSTAGLKMGTATIDFESDGTGSSGLGQISLSAEQQTVNVSAQVNHFAEPTFDQ